MIKAHLEEMGPVCNCKALIYNIPAFNASMRSKEIMTLRHDKPKCINIDFPKQQCMGYVFVLKAEGGVTTNHQRGSFSLIK